MLFPVVHSLGSFPLEVGCEGTLALHQSKGGLSQHLPEPGSAFLRDFSLSLVGPAFPEEAETLVTLYNVLGQQVKTLYDGRPTAGEAQRLRLDASGLSSGVYIVQL